MSQQPVTPPTVATALEQELNNRSIELPLLPNVAAEVLSSSLDDQSNAARLAELIQQDQGLASHLLRVVNSPVFRGTAEIVALQQAIARLGMERIREIALTVSLKGSFFRAGPFEHLVNAAWQHGLRTGLWSKEVARAAVKNVETAYLCGLLHNVGNALVINRACDLDANLSEADMVLLLETFAQQAGLLLVEEWRLPAAVGMCIRFQHDFHEAKNAMDTVAVMNAGAFLAEQQALQTLDMATVLQLPSIQHLNFYPDDIETLLGHAERIQASVEGMA
jgi:HD-like signal output (HDOD) protein